MIFSDDIAIRIVIFILGLCGFAVAKHIHNHKKPNATPLVCPMNFDCHAVVHSDYSKFFGVHVEVFGMIYYALLSLFYLMLIFFPEVLSPTLVVIAIIGSLIAFLFSLYLVGVQFFILKKGCFWCFVSAILCILIFIVTIFAYDVGSIMHAIIK